MKLERHAETVRRHAERGRDPAAVLRHRFRRVTRANTPVQGRVGTLRDPAESGEKTMRETRNPQRSRGQELSCAHADLVVADWKPGGGRNLRSAIAIVLNRAPISP